MGWRAGFRRRGCGGRAGARLTWGGRSGTGDAAVRGGGLTFMKKQILFLGVALSGAMSGAVQADVRLPHFFSEHVVLQRDRELPVWGWAEAGEEVKVELGERRGAARAGADGKWMVRLAAQGMSREPLRLRVEGKNVVEVGDVLLGDVWLCSGQSNMDMALGGCDAAADIAAAELPRVRHFRCAYNFASAPASDVAGEWSVCRPGSAGGFSAVGFYFARRVQAETGVPIGLLTNAVGGTNIELWMAPETLLNTPELAPYAGQMRASLARYRQELGEALPSVERWAQAARAAQVGGQEIPLPPSWPDYPFGERAARPRCVTLHHGHIAPLVPMALRGVLWYQGENNADGTLYREKKAAMVADWRRWFGDAELPFYFVQLAAWQKPSEDPGDLGWGQIRDVQRRCLAIPHTGMAVAVDIGDAEDIHPKNKADVGERLALWALAKNYGKAGLVCSGPLLERVEVANGAARVFFSSVGGGLMVGRKVGRAAAVEDPAGKLQRFALAGADGKWQWAEAAIEGETVLVRSAAVPQPVAVRYAGGFNPAGSNLYNREGLPASPFCAD